MVMATIKFYDLDEQAYLDIKAEHLKLIATKITPEDLFKNPKDFLGTQFDVNGVKKRIIEFEIEYAKNTITYNLQDSNKSIYRKL